jgi:hypothetical protein
MTIIRFPVKAKLGEKPMAVTVPWPVRLQRWLFGHVRLFSWNGVKSDYVRNGR